MSIKTVPPKACNLPNIQTQESGNLFPLVRYPGIQIELSLNTSPVQPCQPIKILMLDRQAVVI